jgi:hypothetical protein
MEAACLKSMAKHGSHAGNVRLAHPPSTRANGHSRVPRSNNESPDQPASKHEPASTQQVLVHTTDPELFARPHHQPGQTERPSQPSLRTSLPLIRSRIGGVGRSTPRTPSRRPMPKSWKMPLSAGSWSYPHVRPAAPSNDDPSVPQTPRPQVIAPTERTDVGQAKGIDKSILTVAAPRRYRNRHLRTSRNRPVSCAAASPRILTTSVSPSPVRSAARSAMSSQSHFVAGIIVRCIAHATSVPGGGRPASIRSRWLADSGKRRTE